MEERDGVRTKRLAVVDDHGTERLVAEVVDDSLEFRIELPSSRPGQRTGLLLFALPGRRDLPDGFGVQFWVRGDMVQDLTWWSDGELR